MPDDGVERFGVRRDSLRAYCRHHYHRIPYLPGIPVFAANDTVDFQSTLLALIQRTYNIHADIFFYVTTADREDENRVLVIGSTGGQPGGKDSVPPFVIGARSQFRDIVYRGLGLDPAQLAKIVDCVAAISRATTDSNQEQPPPSRP